MNNDKISRQLGQFLSFAHAGCYLEIQFPLALPVRILTDTDYLLGEGRTEEQAIKRAYNELDRIWRDET